ncbi:hypothetical protein KAR91_14485, partial [Candidatus Pacearchaeota archaeon]|nr:hypothetical protein [Candidatus Pacearchaeota archaeon]
NDFDNQDEIRRVVSKKYNGAAIGSYRQAFNIAEYFGRKSIEGNIYCSFTGMMDSLGLTVGDVVKVTNNLPGWQDVLFRIVEVSENEDEEAGYLLEFYDASFYTENADLPNAPLQTTLVNPLDDPKHVTGLSLSESGYVNTAGSYIPTLELFYDIPDGDIFWDHVIVQIRTESEANYREYGEDFSFGDGYVIDGSTGSFVPGQTVYIKVISINSRGVGADPSAAPTISEKIDDLITDPAIPSGLMLEGGDSPVDYTWDGLRFAVVWRGASQTGGAGTEPAGQELQGAGGVAIDPFWKYDEVEVWIGGELKHTFNTKALRFEYIYGDGLDAFLDSSMVAANGTVTIKVSRWNLYNRVSDQTEITLTQVAPASPSNLITKTVYRGVRFEWNKNTEADFSYYKARTKVTSGGTWGAWEDLQTNRLDRSLTDAETTASGVDAEIYTEIKTVDVYGNTSAASSTFSACRGVRADDLVAGTITSQVINLDMVNDLGDVAIKAGKSDFGDDTAGFILGIDDSDGDKTKFEIGDAANYLKWDGSNLNIAGSITVSNPASVRSDLNVADGADVTANNTAADIANLPSTPSGSGLFCSDTYLGFYSGGAWKSYIDSSGNMKLGDPSAAKGLEWNQSAGTLNVRGTLNADDIVAGTITGRTLQTASSSQRMVIGASTNNEMVFYSTGTARLASIGISTYGSDSVIGYFGRTDAAYV